ncbi:g11357 [Coccomyxa elongata]
MAEPSGQNNSRGLPSQKGKRKEDDAKTVQTLAGAKKGRSAFGDITNTKREGHVDYLPAHKVKELSQKHGLPYRTAANLVASSEQQKEHPDVERLPCSSGRPGDMDQDASTQPEIIDIDSVDFDNELACSDYVHSIMDHLFQSERKRRPLASYMATVQRDIHANMRGILVDWLVEVALEYKLVSDTLFLAISYIDRFLSLHVVPRQQLQLVGVSCMLLAAKYEEIYAPQVEEFCYITDNTYTKKEILGMEDNVLDALRFELTVPTPRIFLRRFLKASAADWPSCGIWQSEQEYLAAYITELSLPEYLALQWLPSLIAAAAVLVARYTCYAAIPALRSLPIWSPTLVHYTRYRASELRTCAIALHSFYVCAGSKVMNSLPAIQEKYAQPKYKCVSAIHPPNRLPESIFADLQ